MFEKRKFTSHSGLSLDFKIECDALSATDLDCIAEQFAMEFPYRHVWSVPTGGDRFAEALRRHTRDGPVLIADDVLTTGKSIEEKRLSLASPSHARGVVLFARGPCPEWVIPIFTLNTRLWQV